MRMTVMRVYKQPEHDQCSLIIWITHYKES